MRLLQGINKFFGWQLGANQSHISSKTQKPLIQPHQISIAPDPHTHCDHHDHCHTHDHDHHHHSIAQTIGTLPEVKEGFGSALFRHAKQNLSIEAACIAACEVGELSGEFIAYASGIEAFNEIGLATGILAGLSYATYHVMKDHSWLSDSHHDCDHGHSHPVQLDNIGQVALYILTAETGCVLSATSVEYSFGKFLGTPGAPWELENLAVRAIGLPVAFAVGWMVMSLSTLAIEKWKERKSI